MRIPDAEAEGGPVAQFQQAMDDDFNTSGGLVPLFELAKELKRASNVMIHSGKADRPAALLQQQWQTLVCLAQVLGLGASPDDVASPAAALGDTEVEAKIAQRRAAKQAKNYAEADQIRDDLSALGIVLVDKPGGITEWHRG